MGRLSKLSALWVGRVTVMGRYGDGGGLYLQVSKTGTKSWLFRYVRSGQAREMGLGSLAAVTLARAREKAFECRELLDRGVDPLEAREAEKRSTALEQAKTVTFDQAAASYIAAKRPGWKSEKHACQWEATLATYVSPVFGSQPVQNVDTALVLKVLEPIWHSKTETASRVRNRIEQILAWATVRELRAGPNPAQWKNHLDKMLSKRSDVQPVVHHRALALGGMGAFMSRLRLRPGLAPVALEFLILTATRTSETLGARWSEIDMAHKIWVIPAARMKAKREHRIPLSSRCIEILSSVRHLSTGEVVFPGRRGLPMSNMALLAVLRRMEAPTVSHGFRSVFRDWCAERTNFPREVAEMALAHAVGDATERSYFRGDLFLKRRRMMEAWEAFCSTSISASILKFEAPGVSNG